MVMTLRTQGDPNVPAGQLTLEVDLSRPVVLPDLERQRSIEELSRLVLGVHAEVQREGPAPAACPAGEGPLGVTGGNGAVGVTSGGPPEGGAAGESSSEASGGAEASGASRGSSAPSPPESQPFILPLGVMARNEVYPRTCKKW